MGHGDARGEVKGKDANGVGRQQTCTVRPKALLKICDKLATAWQA